MNYTYLSMLHLNVNLFLWFKLIDYLVMFYYNYSNLILKTSNNIILSEFEIELD